MIKTIKRLLREVATPSGNESGYIWAVIACGHILLGAALSSLWFAVIPVYILKEVIDLRRGGRKADSVVDTLLVVTGLTYSGPILWPLLVFLAICVGAVIKESKND